MSFLITSPSVWAFFLIEVYVTMTMGQIHQYLPLSHSSVLTRERKSPCSVYMGLSHTTYAVKLYVKPAAGSTAQKKTRGVFLEVTEEQIGVRIRISKKKVTLLIYFSGEPRET